MFKWHRNQKYDFVNGGWASIDDPDDNPPDRLYILERGYANVNRVYNSSVYNAGNFYDGTGLELSEFQNGFGDPVEHSSMGYAGVLDHAEASHITLVKTNGGDEVPGPDRTLSGRVNSQAWEFTSDNETVSSLMCFIYDAQLLDVSIGATPVGPYEVTRNQPNNKEFKGITRWTNKMTDDDGTFDVLHVEPIITANSYFSALAKMPSGSDLFTNQKYIWTVTPDTYIPVPTFLNVDHSVGALMYKWTMDGAVKETDLIQRYNLGALVPGGSTLSSGLNQALHTANPSFRDDFLRQWELTYNAANPPAEQKVDTSTPTKDFSWEFGSDYKNFGTKTSTVRAYVTGQNPSDPVIPLGKVKINWSRPKKCVFQVKIYGTTWHVPQGAGFVDIVKRSFNADGGLAAQVELWAGLQIANVVLAVVPGGGGAGAEAGAAAEAATIEVTTTGEATASQVADQVAAGLPSSSAEVAAADEAIPAGAEGTTKVEVTRDAEAGEAADTATREVSTTNSGNCFVAGTPVLMADGTLKSIEQVRAGDMVASKDPLTGKQSAKRVLYTFRRLAPVILSLTLGNGESIGTTPGHPFATSSRGNFVLAGNLPLKSELQEFDGHTTTLAAENTSALATPIFNFEVQDWHTYFVGTSHVWVHNQSTPVGVTRNPESGTPGVDGWPASNNWRGRYFAQRRADGLDVPPDYYDVHHRIPQEYRDHPEFADFDFDAPNNLQAVEGSQRVPYDLANNHHQPITNAWADFRAANPNATRSEVEAFARQVDRNQDLSRWFWR